MVATYNHNPPDTLWTGQHWKKRIDLLGDNDPKVKTWVYALNANGKIAAGYVRKNYANKATIWFGDDWKTEKQLGTLREDNSGDSYANAISADGKIIGGKARGSGYSDRAIIWSGSDWQTKTDLGTLRADNLGDSNVLALSANGKVAGGRSDDALYNSVATIWSGEQWETKTALGSLDGNGLAKSEVRALSADGKIAGGYSRHNYDNRAVIWSGNNWVAQDLGTLKADNTGESSVSALNTNGTVAAGESQKDGEYGSVATLWSGKNWQTKTALGSLKADKSGKSKASSLSADGTIVGGYAVDDRYNQYAVLWRVKYNEKNEVISTQVLTNEDAVTEQVGKSVSVALPVYDLSKLEKPKPEVSKKGKSVTTALPTYDLSKLEVSKKGSSVSTELPVYHLPEPEPQPKPQPEVSKKGKSVTTELPVYDTSKIKPPVEVVGRINVDFTINALQKLGADSIALMAMQQHALSRLQQGCHTDQTFCYDVRADFAKSGETKDTAVSFTAGYHFGNGLTLGASFDRSLRRNLPDTYKRNSNNLGWGVFGRWQGENFYVQPAVAWDYYDAQVKRPLYANTETEQHISKIKGLGTSLTLGQDFTLDNKAELGWYLAGRYNRISRTGYAEKNLLFPVKFGDLSLTDTTVALGTKLALPVSDKLKFLAKAEVEQRVGGKNPTYTAAGQYIGNFRYEGKLNKTRAKFSTGVSYAFSPNFKVEVSPYVERSTFGKTRTGGMLSFNGEF